MTIAKTPEYNAERKLNHAREHKPVMAEHEKTRQAEDHEPNPFYKVSSKQAI